MRDLKKILMKVKENGIKYYDELKSRTNDDEGKEMIVFVSKTLNERHVSDIRDEDTDEYIGITKDGWVIYTHDIEYFGGPIRIKNANTLNVNEETVIERLKEYDDDEYVNFMGKVSKIYNKY